MKIIEIETCKDCPYNEEDSSGKYCEKLREYYKKSELIMKKCPLKDKKEVFWVSNCNEGENND